MTGVSIGTNVETNQPVVLPDTSRVQGLYVIGKNGTGKSTLLEQMIVQDMEHGHGIALIDPAGDLTDRVLSRVPVHRIEDLLLYDVAASELPFGLNLFECSNRNDFNAISRTADGVVQAFKKVWGQGEGASWGPMLEDLLRNIAYTLIDNPPYTMTEIPFLLYNKEWRDTLIANITNPVVRDYWKYDYPAAARDGQSTREQRETRRSTINKVRAFLANPTLYNIVGQSTTTIRFREAMDQQKIILVKLSMGAVGEDAVELLGSVLIGQILAAAFSRGDTGYRPQFHLYADEYQRFATPAFSQLIDQARQYGIATTIAHQRRDQLKEERDAPLGAANLIVFGVVPEDAIAFSKQFTAPREVEVIGQRPILIVSQEPLRELSERGHEDQRVRDLVAELSQEHTFVHNRGVEIGEVGTARIKNANTYLVAMMAQQVEVGGNAEVSLITNIVLPFSDSHYEARASMYLVKPVSITHMINVIWDGFQSFSLKPINGDAYRDILNGLVTELVTVEDPREPNLYANLCRWADENEPSRPRSSETGPPPDRLKRTVDLVTAFAALGRLLRRQPVMTESGQYEDITRPRSISDVQNELANKLATQNPYYAYARIRGLQGFAEHQLYIDRSPSATLDPAFVSQTQERMLCDGYLRRREDVEKEIKRRQGEPVEGVPDAPVQPRSFFNRDLPSDDES